MQGVWRSWKGALRIPEEVVTNCDRLKRLKSSGETSSSQEEGSGRLAQSPQVLRLALGIRAVEKVFVAFREIVPSSVKEPDDFEEGILGGFPGTWFESPGAHGLSLLL